MAILYKKKETGGSLGYREANRNNITILAKCGAKTKKGKKK